MYPDFVTVHIIPILNRAGYLSRDNSIKCNIAAEIFPKSPRILLWWDGCRRVETTESLRSCHWINWGHFVLLGIASFFANQILYPRHFLVFGRAIFVGSLVVLIAITVKEISQLFLANRTFDLIDLWCSYLVIIAGDVAVRVLKREEGAYR